MRRIPDITPPTPQPEPIFSRFEVAAKELLGNAEVSRTISTIDKNIQYLNQAETFFKKIRRFLYSFPDKKRTFLRSTWKEMEKPETELTVEEINKLKEITDVLNDDPEKIQLVQEIIFTLIAAQDKNLKNRNLEEYRIVIEINHILDVVKHCQKVFPKNLILHLAAAVHDSYKHVSKNYTELGLHELASTALGQVMVREILLKHQLVLGLKQEDIELIVKLIKRAIYTHGNFEFTELQSQPTSHDRIKNLFGQLYIFTKKRSVNPTDKKPNNANLTIAAMNYLDALSGTNATSFIKYNAFYSTQYILDFDSLADYFQDAIFSSFKSNMESPAGNFLRLHKNSILARFIRENRQVKKNIESALEEKFSNAEIEQAYVNLKASFDNLSNNEISRRIFDENLEIFVKAVDKFSRHQK